MTSSTSTSTTAGSSNNNNQNNDNQNNDNDETTKVPDSITINYLEYGFCTKEECLERQNLKRISVFESTIDTCDKEQALRIVDPKLAITKYRRSAATGGGSTATKDGESKLDYFVKDQDLLNTLHHLLFVLMNQRATSSRDGTTRHYHRQQPWYTTVEFVLDRLRSLQVQASVGSGGGGGSGGSGGSDGGYDNDTEYELDAGEQGATTTESTSTVSSKWHLLLIRGLILLRYLSSHDKRLKSDGEDRYSMIDKTSITMIWTSFHQYWIVKEQEEFRAKRDSTADDGNDTNHDDDDEIMYLTTMCHLSNCLLSPSEHTFGWILYHISKHINMDWLSTTKTENTSTMKYPLLQSAVQLISYASRQEYSRLLFHFQKKSIQHDNNSSTRMDAISILGKCCISPVLCILRYHALMQYNTSFAKKEAVSDMDVLLGYNNSISDENKEEDDNQDVDDDKLIELQNKNKMLMSNDCKAFGLPVEIIEDNSNKIESWDDPTPPTIVKVIMKSTAMNDEKLPLPTRRDDDDWVLLSSLTSPKEAPLPSFRVDSEGVAIPNSTWMERIIYHD